MQKQRHKGRTKNKLFRRKANHATDHANSKRGKLLAKHAKRWQAIGDNIESYAFVSLTSRCIGRSQAGTKTKVYRLPDYTTGKIVSFATKRVKTNRIRGIAQSKVHVVHCGDESAIVGMTLDDATTSGWGKRGIDYRYGAIVGKTKKRSIVVPRTTRIELLAKSLADTFDQLG